MLMRARWRLRQTGHWLKRRLASPAVILMYHRVADLANDPYLLGVTPKHFAEHLDVIHAYGCPLRLQQLVEALRDGRVPPRAVVVTFDDGYADNLHQAKPLLERHGIPATVFVTVGQVGRGREFWWDELDRLLLQPGTLPTTLRLSLNGSVHEWGLGERSRYTEEDSQRDRGWHVEREDDPSPRQRVFRDLFERLYLLPSAERWTILDEVTAWAGAKPVARPTHEALTAEEAVHLDQGGLMEVGAHTMTHAVLAALPAAEQRDEIQQSKVRLEAMLGHRVVSFAYPHGSRTPETAALVGEAGFVCACSSDPDAVFRDADPLQLPRIGVRDWDGDAFARWFRWWVGG